MFSISRTIILRFCLAVVFALCLLFAYAIPSFSQGVGARGQWTWMGGSGAGSHSGVYGTLGTPAAGNIPGSRSFAASWIDTDGNLWLFGGNGSDSQSNSGNLNDLWKYSISANQWTWVGGSNTVNQAGMYGTQGTPNAGNIPGARSGAAFWTDSSGNFWLFGGTGYDAAGNNVILNDLWKYDLSTNDWAWIGGNSTISCDVFRNCTSYGVYGTIGVPSATNNPGSRYGASFWSDSSGNLWLFAGKWFSGDLTGTTGFLDDMWEFSPSTNEWTWMGGDNTVSYYGCGGDGGSATFAVVNFPGCRYAATSWTDSSGNFWMFGGYSYDGPFTVYYNYLWQFKPSLNNWAQLDGVLKCTQGPSPDSPLVCDYTATYGTLGTLASANYPGSRTQATSWTDSSGNLWLFGGQGYVADGSIGNLNDLWEFNPAVNQWAWMGGGNSVGQPGVFGTMGIPAGGNIPASTSGGASGWTDQNGNFWLFGLDFWKYVPGITPAIEIKTSSSTLSASQDLTVSISVSGKAGTPTGSVTLTSGSYESPVTTLSSGNATVIVPAGTLPAGADTLVATYTPDAASSSIYISSGQSVPVTVAGFTVQAAGVMVTPGATAGNTSTITLTPAGGFSGSVTLTAVVTSSPPGAQDPPTLSFGSTNPVSISGTTAVMTTLTIQTTAATSSAMNSPKHRFGGLWTDGNATLACILLLAIPARRRRLQTSLGMLLFATALTCGIASCGGGSGSGGGSGNSNPGTTPGNYTVTVTATSGSTTSTGTLIVEVL